MWLGYWYCGWLNIGGYLFDGKYSLLYWGMGCLDNCDGGMVFLFKGGWFGVVRFFIENDLDFGMEMEDDVVYGLCGLCDVWLIGFKKGFLLGGVLL